MTITTRIVPVGSTWGILVPKRLIDRAALSNQVDLRAEAGRTAIGVARRRRAESVAASRTVPERGATFSWTHLHYAI